MDMSAYAEKIFKMMMDFDEGIITGAEADAITEELDRVQDVFEALTDITNRDVIEIDCIGTDEEKLMVNPLIFWADRRRISISGVEFQVGEGKRIERELSKMFPHFSIEVDLA